MRALFIKTAAVLLLVVLFTGCGDEEYDYPASMNITGTGTAYAEPDVATIMFGADITEKDPADAVNQAAEMMDAAFAAALELGVLESDIQTTSYNMWVEEEYDYVTGQYTGETLYHLSHYAQVEISDLESVGEVLAALVSAGSNTISGVSFHVEDPAVLLIEARSLAIADATRIAEQYAEELGMELGDATYVSEWANNNMVSMASTVYESFAAGMSAPSISSGTHYVSLSVQITFEMN